ncbi:cell division protein ZapB [Kushneria marisflavi]|uniref:Cell division protein ZapB n=1 Tax=Kushneria marisflavi TaxID=157779 RepID=A0A240URM9_9GAMM|nr:cell division protein ZapB [Kushneria marisflavi]ART63733.1 cell division protein ZapB [Kushneria marisflavi]RKD85416.1 cell division protein ZapB [Kushneria marisflavi]
MSNELFEQLEQRVNSAVDTIEMQRMELEELRQENERLKNERQQWESRLGGLLERFRELDTSTASDTAPAAETPATSPSW